MNGEEKRWISRDLEVNCYSTIGRGKIEESGEFWRTLRRQVLKRGKRVLILGGKNVWQK